MLLAAVLLLAGCVPSGGREKDINYADGEWHTVGLTQIKIGQPVRIAGKVQIYMAVGNPDERILQPVKSVKVLDAHAKRTGWLATTGDDTLYVDIAPGESVQSTISTKADTGECFLQIEYADKRRASGHIAYETLELKLPIKQ